MANDIISGRNARMMLMIFIASSNVILGFPLGLEQDGWLGLILSMAFFIPLVAIYARLIRLMPGRDLYAMADFALGPTLGWVTALLFGAYCMLLGALVLYNFSTFIQLSALRNTPHAVILLALFLPILYLAKSGIITISRISAILMLILCVTTVLTLFFSLPKIDIRLLMPVANHTPRAFLTTAAKMSILPFGEVAVLLTAFDRLDRKARVTRVYLSFAAIMLIYLLVVFVRTCGILGPQTMDTVLYPNYRAVTLIQISDFFERIESVIAFIYLLGSLSKVAICILGAAKGAARIFRLPGHTGAVLPIAFATLGLAAVIFSNLLEMFEFTAAYYAFAVPFQVVIPVAVWLAAEIRLRGKPLA